MIPVKPIKLSTTQRKAPNFERFLNRFLFHRTYSLASTIVASIGALGCVVSAILVGVGVLGPGFVLWILANIFGVAFLGGLGALLWLNKTEPVAVDEHLTRESSAIGHKFKASIVNNKLYREVHPAAIELLESASTDWKRVYDATEGTLWKGASAPAHYQGVRAQARSNADQAMMEILLSLRTSINPVGQSRTLIDGLQSMLDAFGVTLNARKADEPLPVGFDDAKSLAQNLRELAEEIEASSLKALRSASSTSDSADNIRQTLEHLRQIRNAEAELEDETGIRSRL